ncbi:MAG TPA: IS630 family transposase, partial [Gemmataceae bacterium]|nr:IS630 family transposase [Gemmataceae bacterium]
TRVLVLVVDSAGWHTATRLPVPADVRLHVLPPCTPQLQPVEAFWPLAREAVANRSIGRIDRLRSILRTRLTYLARNPSVVQPRVAFRWTQALEQ